jgi:hypothetical protein
MTQEIAQANRLRGGSLRAKPATIAVAQAAFRAPSLQNAASTTVCAAQRRARSLSLREMLQSLEAECQNHVNNVFHRVRKCAKFDKSPCQAALCILKSAMSSKGAVINGRLLATNRGIAQLVERRSPKPQVVGSSPAAPATFSRRAT